MPSLLIIIIIILFYFYLFVFLSEEECTKYWILVLFFSSDDRSLIDEAIEQPISNVPLVELHVKLVSILWIVMGLEMKSVKPLTLFNTTVSPLCTEHDLSGC